MEGNKNTYAFVSNDLHPPIIARYVRLIPITRLSTTICMRVELYGCPWEGRKRENTVLCQQRSRKHTFRGCLFFYYFSEVFTPPQRKVSSLETSSCQHKTFLQPFSVYQQRLLIAKKQQFITQFINNYRSRQSRASRDCGPGDSIETCCCLLAPFIVTVIFSPDWEQIRKTWAVQKDFLWHAPLCFLQTVWSPTALQRVSSWCCLVIPWSTSATPRMMERTKEGQSHSHSSHISSSGFQVLCDSQLSRPTGSSLAGSANWQTVW